MSIASALRTKRQSSLTLEQIEDCKVGPQGDRAIGVTVTKWFDGVKVIVVLNDNIVVLNSY